MAEEAEPDIDAAALCAWVDMWNRVSVEEEGFSSSSQPWKPKSKKKIISSGPDMGMEGDVATWLAAWADATLEEPERADAVPEALNPYAIIITPSVGSDDRDTHGGNEEGSVDLLSERCKGVEDMLRALADADFAQDPDRCLRVLQQLQLALEDHGPEDPGNANTSLDAVLAASIPLRQQLDDFVARELLTGSVAQLILRVLRHASDRIEHIGSKESLDEHDDEACCSHQAVVDQAGVVLSLM